ncbi:hypothetical protein DS421_12g377620 [Arachis hypogaea]|nr:hypothetical protein DS421_12g377620 [Arachis hypogaea]
MDLSFNKGLKGPLSPEIGDLSNLNILILAGCSFSGSIPDALRNLAQLSFFCYVVRILGLYGEGDSVKQEFAAASSYYLQANSLWPSSGNPHHQLALLASYSEDELAAAYHYFRSLVVESRFSTAKDNLIAAFEKSSYKEQQDHRLVNRSDESTGVIHDSQSQRAREGRRVTDDFASGDDSSPRAGCQARDDSSAITLRVKCVSSERGRMAYGSENGRGWQREEEGENLREGER